MSGDTPAPVRLRHAWLIAAGVIALALALRLVTEAFLVPSSSMEPTLLPGDHVLVVRCFFAPPRRGDVIVFKSSPEKNLIKRVIGLPGDSVRLSNGQVLINGELLAEGAYAIPSQSPVESTHIVPRDHLFLLGDNRDHSSDSREFGFVPLEAVVGRARMIYWSTSAESSHGGVRWRRILSAVK